VERAKNRTKSRVRSKVEHVFAVMKLKFGFVKLRYRGLQKNATQLFAVCALVNLYLGRSGLPRTERIRECAPQAHGAEKTVALLKCTSISNYCLSLSLKCQIVFPNNP